MNDVVKTEAAEGFLLAKYIGRREAFSLVAGRCSAADIETLRRIRNEKLYLSVSPTWDEFCTDHLHVARRSLNREIAYLDEFGPAFFTVRQLTRITVPEYRQIASQVSAQGLAIEGAVVPLDPENGKALDSAVDKLLRQGAGSPDESPKASAKATAYQASLKHCQAAAKSLLAVRGLLDNHQRLDLEAALSALRTAAATLGVR